jgi:hypothetical protein
MVGSLLGGLFANNQLSQGIDNIQGLAEFNPQNAAVGGLGQFGFGDQGASFQLDPALQAAQQGISGMLPGLLQGGLANQLNPAMASQGGIGAAANQANLGFMQQAQGMFNPAMFGQTAGNIGGLGNFFAQQAAQGPQDQFGGAATNLFNQGFQNLQQAGNVGGLIQQNLDAANALAAPGEQQATNRFLDREFSLTGGATSGSGQRGGEFLQAQLAAGNQRVLNAQQFGSQEAARLGQLGLGQFGAGAGMVAQNLNFAGQQAGQAADFAGLGLGTEAQGFGQNIEALTTNQSAGERRLQNMLGLFGAQQGAFEGGVGLGLQGIGEQRAIGELGLQGILGLLNAEANRISGTQGHANAIAGLSADKGGLLGGLF